MCNVVLWLQGWCSATDVELAVRDRAIFVQQLFVWMIGMRNEMVRAASERMTNLRDAFKTISHSNVRKIRATSKESLVPECEHPKE